MEQDQNDKGSIDDSKEQEASIEYTRAVFSLCIVGFLVILVLLPVVFTVIGFSVRLYYLAAGY